MANPKVELTDNSHCCVVTGELTAADRPALRAALNTLVHQSGEIVIDARGLDTIEPAALSELVAAAYRASANGQVVVLIEASGPVTKALTEVGLAPYFQIRSDPAEDWRK